MNAKIAVLDIETLPLPEAELASRMPEFEAASNIKDPVKVAANIAEKRAKWIETAALHADTGQIAVIGFYDGEKVTQLVVDGNTKDTMEVPVVEMAWHTIEGELRGTTALVGHNVRNFDIPFMVRRSMLLGVPWPRLPLFPSRYLNEQIVDTMDLWACGNKQETIKLSELAAAFGLKKTGSGADFAKLWAADRKAALEYNANDLRITYQIATKMLA